MTAHLGTYFQRHIISGSSEGGHGCRQSCGVRSVSIVRHGSVGTHIYRTASYSQTSCFE